MAALRRRRNAIWLAACAAFGAAALARLPPPADERPPIPSAADQKAARQLVLDLFRKEYAAARSLQGSLKLAERLFDESQRVKGNDAGLYVLLDETRRAAVAAGDWPLASLALARLGEQFAVDTVPLELEAIDALTRPRADSARLKEFALRALDLAEESARDNRPAVAEQALRAADKAARLAQDAAFVQSARQEADGIRELMRDRRRLDGLLQDLAARPDDAALTEEVGRIYCFRLHDWTTGLPLLARGASPELKKLAEFEANPGVTPLALAGIGDAWWDWSEKQPAPVLRAARRHALEWYSLAEPGLNGLQKTRIQQRLDEGAPLALGRRELPGRATFLAGERAVEIEAAGEYFDPQGRSLPTTIVRVGGAWRPKSLFTHPTASKQARVRYDLAALRPTQFAADVGLADGAGRAPGSPLVFEVWGDGQLLWRSPPLQRTGATVPCRVRIVNVKTLELRVQSSGSTEAAWAVWCGACVVR